MKLSLLITLAGIFVPAGEYAACDIRKIITIPAEAGPGTLFLCIRGRRHDGHADAEEAAAAGAVTLGERRLPGVQLLYPDTREALAKLLAAFYSHPEKKLALYGITGTNGKTTTALLLSRLLTGCGIGCGCIGTLGLLCGGESFPLSYTTPVPGELYPALDRLQKNCCQAAVLEASSQGLDQKRLAGLHFSVGVFLNLSREHLDYHGDMEHYFQAKTALFRQCRKAVICIDDPYGERLAAKLPPGVSCITFGRSEQADWQLSLTEGTLSGSRFRLTERKTGKSGDFVLPLFGSFLAEDGAAAVLAAAAGQGITLTQAAKILQASGPVPGRAEDITPEIPRRPPFTVIRDYAHTPEALRQLFSELNRFKGRGRLIGVYGCGGERDSGKRPQMAAEGLACDILILTSDNPRGENPVKILEDMKKGLPEQAKCSIIYSRADAIAEAVSRAEPGDIIALCGKGHEICQLAGGRKLPCDEPQLVQKAWAERSCRA